MSCCRGNAVWQTGTGRGGTIAGLLLLRLVEGDVLRFVVNLRRTGVLSLAFLRLASGDGFGRAVKLPSVLVLFVGGHSLFSHLNCRRKSGECMYCKIKKTLNWCYIYAH